MKTTMMIFALLTVFCMNAFAEAENEIPTLAEFEKATKSAQVKSKVESVPSADKLQSDFKNLKGKQFRMSFFAEKMHGFGCKAKPKPMCEFNYLSIDSGGMGKEFGQGLYSLECYNKKACLRLEEIAGQEATFETVIVEMTDIVEMPDGQGKKVRAPLLKVIKLTD